MFELKNKNILVTGACGFIGQHLVPKLEELVGEGGEVTTTSLRLRPKGPNPCFQGDLTSSEDVEDLFRYFAPFDAVIHLAGWNGGIHWNKTFPANVFHQNTVMGLNVLDAARRHNVKKVLSVVTSCAYPEDPILGGIYPEYQFLEGKPHASVACHGYAKRNLQIASAFYRQQYGMEAICVCPTTVYGPGDCTDAERTKIVMAMVKRFTDACEQGKDSVTCWGTGNALREFLYVEDCVTLLLKALEVWDQSDVPLNIGTGQEFPVRYVAEEVAASVGYNGAIVWDSTKPTGQHRKRLDNKLQKHILGETQFTSFEEGLRKTVEWYKQQ